MDNVKTKEQLEKEHSEYMNQQAVEKLKKESMTQEEADRISSVFFEDDEEIKLRDGKTYKISPCSLKKARRLMTLLKTVNLDVIMLNYVPTGDIEKDDEREQELLEVIMIAFSNYPEMTVEYIQEYVDFVIAKRIIEVVIGLNGLVKK